MNNLRQFRTSPSLLRLEGRVVALVATSFCPGLRVTGSRYSRVAWGTSWAPACASSSRQSAVVRWRGCCLRRWMYCGRLAARPAASLSGTACVRWRSPAIRLRGLRFMTRPGRWRPTGCCFRAGAVWWRAAPTALFQSIQSPTQSTASPRRASFFRLPRVHPSVGQRRPRCSGAKS